MGTGGRGDAVGCSERRRECLKKGGERRRRRRGTERAESERGVRCARRRAAGRPPPSPTPSHLAAASSDLTDGWTKEEKGSTRAPAVHAKKKKGRGEVRGRGKESCSPGAWKKTELKWWDSSWMIMPGIRVHCVRRERGECVGGQQRKAVVAHGPHQYLSSFPQPNQRLFLILLMKSIFPPLVPHPPPLQIDPSSLSANA